MQNWLYSQSYRSVDVSFGETMRPSVRPCLWRPITVWGVGLMLVPGEENSIIYYNTTTACVFYGAKLIRRILY